MFFLPGVPAFGNQLPSIWCITHIGELVLQLLIFQFIKIKQNSKSNKLDLEFTFWGPAAYTSIYQA